MKIGIDIDGVILDYERTLKTYGELYDLLEVKGNGVIKKDEQYLNNRYNWNEEELNGFVDKYFIQLTRETAFIPGAKDVIKMLKEDGHELIIISARGASVKEMKDAAEEVLQKAGLSFDKYYWQQVSKIEIAKKEQIDLMIDDTYEVCKALSENGVKVIYFRDNNMKKLQEGEYVKEVSNWGEIYRYIKNY